MHILLIHQALVTIDEPGGTRHHELARSLAARGHKVTLITSPVSYLTGKEQGQIGKWAEQVDGEVVVIRTYVYTELHRSFVHRVVNFFSFMASSFLTGLRVKDVDLVWGTSPPIFQGVTAWALARIKKVPFLFEVRDLWPAFAVQIGVLKHPFLIKLSEWLERFLYQHADRIIVNSPGYIKHVMDRCKNQVDLVPNGSDTSMFDPQADGWDFRQKYALQDRFVVLYAGAHGMSNDLGVVLEAANLLQDLTELVIVLVGDGKEKPDLMERTSQMGLKNVRFVPPVSKLEMKDILAAADACLAILKPIPLYATVYPNKVFDYMAAGRAVILAIDGVIRQVVEQAGAGIPVPPGDPHSLAQAMRELEIDRDATRRMGKRGRLYIEDNFDRSIIARTLIQIMEDMHAANRQSS